MNYGGGNGAGCFEVKVWADTAKFTDVIVTRHATSELHKVEPSTLLRFARATKRFS